MGTLEIAGAQMKEGGAVDRKRHKAVVLMAGLPA
jgi:hypothetical protein